MQVDFYYWTGSSGQAIKMDPFVNEIAGKEILYIF